MRHTRAEGLVVLDAGQVDSRQGMQAVSPMTGAHKPLLTAAGHFLSMQPVTDPMEPLDKVWYQGTEFAAMHGVAIKRGLALQQIVDVLGSGGSDTDELLRMVMIAEAALK